MTTRTIAFVVISDEQGCRIRCCFCGAVLLGTQDTVEIRNLPQLTEQLNTHSCYQCDALLPAGLRLQLRPPNT